MVLGLRETKNRETAKSELQVEVHVSPAVFKNISKWMTNLVNRYEELFGEIVIEPIKKEPKKKESPKSSDN